MARAGGERWPWVFGVTHRRFRAAQIGNPGPGDPTGHQRRIGRCGPTSGDKSLPGFVRHKASNTACERFGRHRPMVPFRKAGFSDTPQARPSRGEEGDGSLQPWDLYASAVRASLSRAGRAIAFDARAAFPIPFPLWGRWSRAKRRAGWGASYELRARSRRMDPHPGRRLRLRSALPIRGREDAGIDRTAKCDSSPCGRRSSAEGAGERVRWSRRSWDSRCVGCTAVQPSPG